MNPIAIRLLSQQLISPQFDTPREVVSHFGAIQAQDYRMVRWAVAMRTRKPKAGAFKKAFDEGEIVRLHLLRCTWQLVAQEDYRWMLDLCAAKATTALNGWMKQNNVVIETTEQNKIHDIFVRKTDDIGSATSDDLNEALLEEGIKMDRHRLSYHIRLNELNGTLCSGDLQPMKATFSLTEKKIPQSAKMNRDEKLALLARKYFRSHSPASLEDFVWWSGLNAAECKRGIEYLETELRAVKWKGSDFYIHEACRTRGFRNSTSHLLAPFDEYLIGYKSRELAINPNHMPYAYTNNGIFYPVVASGGRICGNWRPWEKKLKVRLFGTSDKELYLESQWNLFNRMVK